MEKQRNTVTQLKANLATLQSLDIRVPNKDWNPKTKEYKHRTEGDYYTDIASGERLLQNMEKISQNLKEDEKRLPDWARNELSELEEKYGKAVLYGTNPRVECMWDGMDIKS